MAQLKTKIMLLNGTQAQWEDLQDHILSQGEPAVEFVTAPNEVIDGVITTKNLTAVKIKVGDGRTAYKDLPYIGDHLVSNFEDRFDTIEATIASSGNAVFQIAGEALVNIAGDSEGDKIAKYISEVEKVSVNEGNIAIVTKEIAPGVLSYTAYVYNGTSWAAMDGNYDAKNIYFSKDLTYTSDIGALKLPEGATSSTYEATGKSLEALISRLMAETIAPTIKQPTFALSASASSNTTAASKEIGSYITTLKWDGTFTDGTYSFGYEGGTGTADTAAGCTATYEVSCDKAGTPSVQGVDGTWTLTDKIQIDNDSSTGKTYATITNKCTWGNSPRTPINNIGEAVDGAITASSSEKSAGVKVVGYRNSFYYVGTDNETTVDSAFIRSGTARNANTKNFNVTTKDGASYLAIPQGTKRVLIAIPGSATLNEVKDLDGMGLDQKGNFETKTISVEGANNFTAINYTVFVYDKPEGLAATRYTFTIS